MDNLIAEGKAQPFIIVMASSHVPGSANGLGSGTVFANGVANPLSRLVAGPFGRTFDFGAFVHVLIEDLIPCVDANFRMLAPLLFQNCSFQCFNV
jgi:hypothetical protein